MRAETTAGSGALDALLFIYSVHTLHGAHLSPLAIAPANALLTASGWIDLHSKYWNVILQMGVYRTPTAAPIAFKPLHAKSLSLTFGRPDSQFHAKCAY